MVCALVLAGCGKDPDAQYSDKAPPLGPNADMTVKPRTDKNMPTMGAPSTMAGGMSSKPLAKPGG